MRITGGRYNSRKIKTPDYENIKPTLSKTRQGIFNSLLSMVEPDGKIFLDMFAGSGIMSLEAISRGFRVISFEKDKKTAFAIKESFKSLNLAPELYTGDALKLLLKMTVKPDIIFMDPPYATELYSQALEIILKRRILQTGGIIIMEHPACKVIVTSGFRQIKAKIYGDKQITFLSINQEE